MPADTIDRTTLPAALVPLAKAQAKVEHARDDVLIAEHLAQAIDDVERVTNATLFERTITTDAVDLVGWPLYAWATPGSGNWIGLPFNNVSAFVATDADGLDVSSGYRVRQADIGGVGTAWLQGPTTVATPPITFAITAGLKTPDAIAPALRRLILRRAAALYEYREAALPLSADDLADEPALWRPDL
jgi:uncharacterized phiE125 gp8 family phage protein